MYARVHDQTHTRAHVHAHMHSHARTHTLTRTHSHSHALTLDTRPHTHTHTYSECIQPRYSWLDSYWGLNHLDPKSTCGPAAYMCYSSILHSSMAWSYYQSCRHVRAQLFSRSRNRCCISALSIKSLRENKRQTNSCIASHSNRCVASCVLNQLDTTAMGFMWSRRPQGQTQRPHCAQMPWLWAVWPYSSHGYHI